MAAADGIFTNICWTSCPDLYQVVAFVDADPQRREMIQAETGLKALTDYKELFAFKESIDLVVNASFTRGPRRHFQGFAGAWFPGAQREARSSHRGGV